MDGTIELWQDSKLSLRELIESVNVTAKMLKKVYRHTKNISQRKEIVYVSNAIISKLHQQLGQSEETDKYLKKVSKIFPTKNKQIKIGPRQAIRSLVSIAHGHKKNKANDSVNELKIMSMLNSEYHNMIAEEILDIYERGARLKEILKIRKRGINWPKGFIIVAGTLVGAFFISTLKIAYPLTPGDIIITSIPFVITGDTFIKFYKTITDINGHQKNYDLLGTFFNLDIKLISEGNIRRFYRLIDNNQRIQGINFRYDPDYIKKYLAFEEVKDAKDAFNNYGMNAAIEYFKTNDLDEIVGIDLDKLTVSEHFKEEDVFEDIKVFMSLQMDIPVKIRSQITQGMKKRLSILKMAFFKQNNKAGVNIDISAKIKRINKVANVLTLTPEYEIGMQLVTKVTVVSGSKPLYEQKITFLASENGLKDDEFTSSLLMDYYERILKDYNTKYELEHRLDTALIESNNQPQKKIICGNVLPQL